jgi:hypothetical protein
LTEVDPPAERTLPSRSVDASFALLFLLILFSPAAARALDPPTADGKPSNGAERTVPLLERTVNQNSGT